MISLSQPRLTINDETPVLIDVAALARALPGYSDLAALDRRQRVSARTVVNAARRGLRRFNANTKPYEIAAYLRSVGESAMRSDPAAVLEIAVLAA